MEDILKQINDIKEEYNKLRNSSTIPKDIDSAFRARLSNLAQQISISGTSATAHNQAVNEAGSGSYSVLSTPTGYLTVNVNGTPRDIPYF